MVVNCDESVKDSGLRASCAGLVRDDTVNLFGAYNIMVAELWGIHYGLKLTWDHGFRRIKVLFRFTCSYQFIDVVATNKKIGYNDD